MKKLRLLLATALLTLSMGITAFAGMWQQNTTGWWYQNDDGTYPVNCWQWIDGNGDGTAENYYFNESGFCLMNTTTPDGNAVDANGAWIVNGVVQTQTLTAQLPQTTQTTTNTPTQSVSGISSTPYDGYTIVVNTGTKKYHFPKCSSVSKMAAENTGYCSDAAYLTSQGYVACKRCH